MSRVVSDILRIISALAVIAIHSTAHDELLFHETGHFISSEFLGVIVNQITRFSVPIFILLSGYGLTKSMIKKTDGSLARFPFKNYFSSRFRKIIIPYMFLSFLFLLIGGKFNDIEFSDALFVYARSLLLGDADYHFYFLSIILQCYLLFPLLITYANSIVLLALFIIHLLLMYPVTQLYADYVNFPPASLFIYWIFYFYAGIFYAKNENLIATVFQKNTPLLYLFSFTLIIILGEYVLRARKDPDPAYYNHFNRISVTFYVIVSLFLFTGLIRSVEEKLSPIQQKHIAEFSALTFPIYLYHTQFLRLLDMSPVQNYSILLSLLTTLLTTIIVYGAYRWLPDRLYIKTITAIPERGRF